MVVENKLSKAVYLVTYQLTDLVFVCIFGPFRRGKMATGGLTLDSILDMTVDELGIQLISRGQDIKGLNKPDRQKRLIRLLGKETEEVAPVEEERYGSRESVLGVDIVRVSSPVQSVGGLIRDEDFELHKLRLQVELEARKMRVEETKLRIEMEAREKDYDRRARFEMEEKRFRLEEADKKARFELDETERKARFEMEEKEKTARLEMEENDKKAAYALELRKLEAAEREQIRKHGLRAQGIRVDEVGHTEDTDSFRMSSAIKFVPKFQEQDLEQFLLNFEKSMEIPNFPKDKCKALIHTKLTGKASKVFSALSTEQCKDYDIVKAALLTAYSRIPEFYRKKFRNLTRGHLETFSNFAFRLQLPFQSWIDGDNVAKDADKLKELFKLEQFVNCLPKDIHKCVLERHPTSLMEAAKLADEYEVLTRPFKMDASELSNWHNKFKGNGEWRKSQQNSSSSNDYVWQSPFRNNNSTSADHADTNSNWRRPNQNKSPPRNSHKQRFPKALGARIVCSFCSKGGHD